MIVQEVKTLLKYVLEMNIRHIQTFTGYKGDTVVKLILEVNDDIPKITKFAENLGFEVRQDYEMSGKYGGFFNLFISFEHKDLYQLKPGV